MAGGRGIAGSVLTKKIWYLRVQYKHVSTRCMLHITVTHMHYLTRKVVLLPGTRGVIPRSRTLNIVSSCDTEEIKAMRCALL